MTNILNMAGLDWHDMLQALQSLPIEKKDYTMRRGQMWKWIYAMGTRDFDGMTDLPKSLRTSLAETCSLGRPAIASTQVSKDGTHKWLLRLADNSHIETVYIPGARRGTLCVSSQVGCTLNCSFCHTGTQQLVRNLTSEEIIAQVLLARDQLRDWPYEENVQKTETRCITNIVFMGMGEPLYNCDNVIKAIKVLCHDSGLAFSKRRVTVSTAGVVPMIARCGEEAGAMLAISLHATNDTLRNQLIPLNKKYPLKDLLHACREYPTLSNARRITFEYVLLKDVNDTPKDARDLIKLLRGIPAKVNLIPFNPWPGCGYECSTPQTIDSFARTINRAGYASPVRTPRGQDIMAACGQLKSASLRLPSAKRLALRERNVA